jgi:adenylate cyclase
MFDAVVDALTCAVRIQEELGTRNVDLAEEHKVEFRIGVNLGDVIEDRGDIYGDGVNVAARLEGLAKPGGVCVSDAVRTAVGKKLGLIYEDMGMQSVKNIAEVVHCYRVRFPGEYLAHGGSQNSRQESTLSSTGVSPIDVSKPVQGFSGRPAIAVLPFESLNKDAEHDFFADSIAEDILTKLAMWRWLPVIARNSSFAYKERSVDLKEVGKELGARYLLQGTVRKAGNRVRISGLLVDAETNHHVWAQRYDGELDDIFAVQDEITDSIVAALEPAVGRAEMQRAYRRDPQNLDAWNLYQRGMSCLVKTTREDMGNALEFFRRSSVADPRFAAPLAAIAVTEFIKLTIGFNEGHTGLPSAASEAAMRAVVLYERLQRPPGRRHRRSNARN